MHSPFSTQAVQRRRSRDQRLAGIAERSDSDPQAAAHAPPALRARSRSADADEFRASRRPYRGSLDRRQPQLAVPSATAVDIANLEALRRSMTPPRPLARHSATPAMTGNRPDRDAAQRPALLPRAFSLSDAAAWQGVDLQDRGAFAIGSGTSLRVPSGALADGVHRSLATHAEGSEHQQSWVPLMKLVPTFLGKVAITLGADMLTLGASRSQLHLLVPGAVVLAAGIGSVCAGISLLMRDMRMINPGRIRMTIVFTWVGVSLSAIGITVGESDRGAQDLVLRTGMAVVFGAGLTMMNYSLPLSFAYSEVVHGDIFRAHRTEASFALLGLGLAAATGLTVSRGAPDDEVKPRLYPFGVAHACAGVGIAGVTMATCLVATNLQRMHGRLLALRARLRHAAGAAGA